MAVSLLRFVDHFSYICLRQVAIFPQISHTLPIIHIITSATCYLTLNLSIDIYSMIEYYIDMESFGIICRLNIHMISTAR